VHREAKSVYGINLSPLGYLLQPFELYCTNRHIGGVWDLPIVPSWSRGGASGNKMAEN